jgi:hypothetical protein
MRTSGLRIHPTLSNTPLVNIQVLMTRAHVTIEFVGELVLNLQVSSFQINLMCGFENKLLYDNLIIIRNHENDEEDVGEWFGCAED